MDAWFYVLVGALSIACLAFAGAMVVVAFVIHNVKKELMGPFKDAITVRKDELRGLPDPEGRKE